MQFHRLQATLISKSTLRGKRTASAGCHEIFGCMVVGLDIPSSGWTLKRSRRISGKHGTTLVMSENIPRLKMVC